MDNVARWLVVGILVLMLCGVVVASENLTIAIVAPPNRQPLFLIGDTVQLSGINHITSETYLKIR
jgi:hypothetical protein